MILELLPLEIVNFLEEIEQCGFSLCLVGGAPRDFFYSSVLVHDLDFEIRPSPSIVVLKEDWKNYLKKIHHFFDERKINYTELPYCINRVLYRDFVFEFSSPRLENNIPTNLTHHHFEAQMDPHLSYELSFKRRDLTLNAIGIELNLALKTEKIIDPFKGLNDLKNKILTNINDDFFSDSVRFLRLIRFKIKFEQFQINPIVLENLNKFNLSSLSLHHFKEELFKSKPGLFLNIFNELVLLHKLKTPETLHFLSHIRFNENLSTEDEILAFVFLQNKNEAQFVVTLFSMTQKKLKSLESFYHSLQNICSLLESDYTHLLSCSPAEALDHPILQDLKNLEEKKLWRFILKAKPTQYKMLIDWDDWEKIKVDPDELNQIKKQQRSFYKFYKSIKMKFDHD